ncbi:LysR family transcriptional regulator [Gallaecimonas kandeliae]|uniref:LysR family transcriptional regulator n=1 Tax=Gallaecimonas kandeliae TaxID=3029055 RepID=UPI0026472804|nr:LysR family transcriptional regulator [Gallaecimonas kandeliae]WKE65109.1 LysR family transcriptional regulator [Gallaecimonas kandeliae]
MKNQPSLDDLRLFCRLVELGSYTRAGQALGVPVSTLSRRIRGLEERLGVRLLHRNAHQLQLTAVGQRYHHRCLPLVSELESVTANLDEELHQPKGLLRIAAPLTQAHHDLGALFTDFALAYPDINLELSLSNNNINLEEAAVDLAFRVGQQADSAWIGRHLDDLPFEVYGPAHWPEADSPEALAALPWVQGRIGDELPLRHRQTRQGVDISPRLRLRVNDLQLAAQAAAKGLGAVLLPSWLAAEIPGLKPLAPSWHGPVRPFYLLYRDRANQPLRLRLFIEHALAWVAKRP